MQQCGPNCGPGLFWGYLKGNTEVIVGISKQRAGKFINEASDEQIKDAYIEVLHIIGGCASLRGEGDGHWVFLRKETKSHIYGIWLRTSDFIIV